MTYDMAKYSEYDPNTLHHWLWYKLQCHEATPTEFQRLFENIMKRAKPEFMQIRPYGSIGDRKCDGLLLCEGWIFQVYAPDEMKLGELTKKIEGDLDFAVEHWNGVLRAWTFVYNARRGVGPDVASLLGKKQRQYPHIKIDSLSSDALWEIARELTLQQRTEVLGAPAVYDSYSLASDNTYDMAQSILQRAWTVIVQDTMAPINLQAVTAALAPDVPLSAPFFIRPYLEKVTWDEAVSYQREVVTDLIEKTREVLPRYAIFSLSQIPLAIHLGFLLSDRLEVQLFQYNRDRQTWQWGTSSHTEKELSITGLPEDLTTDEIEVVIRVSLSATVWQHQTDAVLPGSNRFEIDIAIANPDVMWLTDREQLTELATVFRTVLSSIRSHTPRCSRIHLFYAGPTGGAIAIGRQINPNMCPPIALYNFSYTRTPQYEYALTLHTETYRMIES